MSEEPKTSLEKLQPLLKEVYIDAIDRQLNARVVGYFSTPTPEQAARIAEQKAKREKERKDLNDLLASPNYLKPIIDLHSPNKYDECEGCDFGGYEGDMPSWPCRTIDLVVEMLKGIK